MICFLDLDGVVVDLVGGVAKALDLTLTHLTWPPTYDLSVATGLHQDDLWNHDNIRGAQFWAELEKLPWADAVVRTCLDKWSEVCFLSQTVRDPGCAAGKSAWIKRHYPRMPFLLGTRKVLVAAPGFTLIDDYEENVDSWIRRGGHGVLFPAPWNRHRGLDVDSFISKL